MEKITLSFPGRRAWAAVLMGGVMLAACAAPPAPPPAKTAPSAPAQTPSGPTTATTTGQPIIVGSKLIPEQFILAEMYSLLLEKAGFTVERRFGIGPTEVIHDVLRRGEIDLYPEYTGTALVDVLNLPTKTDPLAVFDDVSRAYAAQFGLVWLAPANINNTQAIAMTKSRAAELRVVTLSDFVQRARELAAAGTPLVLAGPPEFVTRNDGLAGIRRGYGAFDVDYRPVSANSRYQQLNAGAADAVVAFGTDGEIGGFDLVTLIDDKQLFPPYEVAPVVQQATLDRAPQVRDALNPLAPLLNDDALRELNFMATSEGVPTTDIARDFLIEQGLISGTVTTRGPNYVGNYRVAAFSTAEQIDGQINATLNADNTASVTWVSFITDTLDALTGNGTWTQLGSTVNITITDLMSEPLTPPAQITFTFDGLFLLAVNVQNDPTGETQHKFFIASGDSDPVVGELHQRMAAVPWLNFVDRGPSDIVYDEPTRQAIVVFQESQGILPSGIVDAETWLALKSPKIPVAGAPAAPAAAPTYEPPSTATPQGMAPSRLLGRSLGRSRALAPVAQELVPTRVPPTVPPTMTPSPAPAPAVPTSAPAPSGPCTPSVAFGGAVNLRQGPSTDTEALATIPGGTTLPATGVNPDKSWYRVNFYGTAGWVFGQIVTPQCVDGLPVVDVPVPPPQEKVIYLSFDDGPHATWTMQIIQVLQQNNAKAVFFQIGQQVAPLGDIVKQQLAAGMSVSNHTWNHASLAGMAQTDFVSEVSRTNDAQVALGAHGTPGTKCLRPPYGATDGNTRGWAEQLGYRLVLWSIDPQDWALPGTQQIVSNILSNARPGAIVLSHDGGGNRSQTLDAYRVALPQLAQQGYRFELMDCP